MVKAFVFEIKELQKETPYVLRDYTHGLKNFRKKN
jgi:hypothetical protein